MQVQIQNIKYQQPQIWVCHVPRRTNMKNTKLSLHILKFDASMSCESNEHPVDLCMIIMLFLLCPHLQLQTLESGSSRSSMPVEQSVVWKWDISKGTMGIIPGLYVTVADNAANKYLIPNHLAINPILVSFLPIHIHMIISSSWTPFLFFPSLL